MALIKVTLSTKRLYAGSYPCCTTTAAAAQSLSSCQGSSVCEPAKYLAKACEGQNNDTIQPVDFILEYKDSHQNTMVLEDNDPLCCCEYTNVQGKIRRATT